MKSKFFLLLSFAILFALPVNAQEGGGVVCPPPPTCPAGNVWDEYQCTSVCNADIQTRRVWEWYTLESSPSEGCPAYSCQYHIQRGPWSKIQSCQPWQGCGPQGVLKNTKPECSCAGACLETPKNPRYYDDPDHSDKPDKSMPSTNVKLPVKFDWDDVEGWLKSPDGPKSYIFKFQDAITKILGKSEYAELREEKGACFLKSNSDYSWQARACCSDDGKNCGAASNWSFTASLAPELISPEDPDWAGPKGTGNIVITPDSPMKIDWCDVKEAKSYRLRIFFEDEKTGKKTCHPILDNPFAAGDKCESWLIDKERRDPYQIEKLLYSDFTDTDLDFFTKDTTYDWEVKMCPDDYGGLEAECKDYSQRWSFTSEQKAFKELALLSPPNDPGGETPVGLPLILDWSAPSGMNSFMYQINGISYITQVSQSKALNIPDLSVNRFYKWRVKACSDYQALECEEFSPERTFKTTGQPPILENPAPGASAVPIPINLSWQGVPGAKSYVMKIQGQGLDITTTTDQSEFFLAFPEYPIHQETNYSWQIKTCAHDGWACGQYSPARTFRTFRLPTPSGPSPENNGRLPTNQGSISWQNIPEAKAYQYKIKYLTLSSDESNESCKTSVGGETVPLKTILTNSDFIELSCLGQYQWQAKACLDENCTETSGWSDWTFLLAEPTATAKGGLVPCGRDVDNPKTPWNERESCQIGHIFLLIKILIDFIFLRLIPAVLVLLTIATGVMFYFSMGGRIIPILNIKRLWKSVGIAFLIAMFTWTMINLVLKLIGYQIGIFGNWYVI